LLTDLRDLPCNNRQAKTNSGAGEAISGYVMPDFFGRARLAISRRMSRWLAALTARFATSRIAGSRPILLLVLGCILVAGAVTVTTILLLSDLRDRAIADSERELQNTALVLAAQTDRAFQGVDLVESSVIERMQYRAKISSAGCPHMTYMSC
jgi:hypothetical protein